MRLRHCRPARWSTRPDLRTFAVALPETLLRAALFVAGPALAIAFVAQVALAAVARLVPRFSTFTLAFPVVFACVLLATLAALPAVLGAAATAMVEPDAAARAATLKRRRHERRQTL